MKYKSYKDASNRLTVSIDGLPSLAYRFVRWKLCRRFGLKKTGAYVNGLDEKFQSFHGSEGEVSIDWDIWSGFTVTALAPESENMVKEIGEYLEKKYT